MHTIFAVRGIKHRVERFIDELSTRYLPANVPMPDGTIQRKLLQVRVSPIQLYDVSFPAEHKDAVLNTIYGGSKGEAIHGRFTKYASILRKVLGLKPIPDYSTGQRLPMLPPEDTEIIAIGSKEDYFVNAKGEHSFKFTDEEKKECYEGI